MTQREPALPAKKHRHFLFYIFRMDKETHPLPEHLAAKLLLQLKNTLTDYKRSNRYGTQPTDRTGYPRTEG